MPSEIPYEDLKTLLVFLEKDLQDKTARSPSAPSEDTRIKMLSKAIHFFKVLSRLYWPCPICGRHVAPDEPYQIVNEEPHCQSCAEEGN